MATTVWNLPYSAQQLQNTVANQVPRINPTTLYWERWDIATGAWVDTGVMAKAYDPVYGTVTLPAADWVDDDPLWHQVVTIDGATAYSAIDLLPTAEQLGDLSDDGVGGLTVENNNGTITVYAVGACPSATMTMQYRRIEVSG